MSPLEAFADAIMTYEGWHRSSHSWRNRNPGNLRPTLVTQACDSAGYRVFDSLALGWQALLDDLNAKVVGGSHGLTPHSTILDLLSVYAPAGDHNNPSAYTQFVCAWVSSVVGHHVTASTTLDDYFGLSSG